MVTQFLLGWYRSFPAAATTLLAFISYQSYRLMASPSVQLLGLTVLDIAVVALVIHEWHVRRSTWKGPA